MITKRETRHEEKLWISFEEGDLGWGTVSDRWGTIRPDVIEVSFAAGRPPRVRVTGLDLRDDGAQVRRRWADDLDFCLPLRGQRKWVADVVKSACQAAGLTDDYLRSCGIESGLLGARTRSATEGGNEDG